MGDIFKLIGDLGFPIAVALAGGYFVYLTIKLLLQGVLGSIKGMAGIITALDNRVKTMNHDVVRIAGNHCVEQSPTRVADSDGLDLLSLHYRRLLSWTIANYIPRRIDPAWLRVGRVGIDFLGWLAACRIRRGGSAVAS